MLYALHFYLLVYCSGTKIVLSASNSCGGRDVHPLPISLQGSLDFFAQKGFACSRLASKQHKKAFPLGKKLAFCITYDVIIVKCTIKETLNVLESVFFVRHM